MAESYATLSELLFVPFSVCNAPAALFPAVCPDCISNLGSAFSSVFGMKYVLPGSTSRTEETSALTCFKESMITFFSSIRIRLLCFPINSKTRIRLHKSPISSRCSTAILTTRSSPGSVTSRILPPCRCFLKTMQKFGAVIGDGLFSGLK